MFDSERFDLYGEPICTEGDFTIQLKRGQGRPDNCPFRLNKNTPKDDENGYPVRMD